MIRWVTGAALALTVSMVPISSVQACSCAMQDDLARTIEAADLALVGTAVDAAPAPRDANGFGQTVRYAFEVERGSMATDAMIEVRALDDPGGAACGFAFGIGERWFVTAYRDGAALHTGLCSGNLRLQDMSPDELARLSELLPFEPAERPDPGSAEELVGTVATILPLGVGALAVVGLMTIMVIAFRRDRTGPAS